MISPLHNLSDSTGIIMSVEHSLFINDIKESTWDEIMVECKLTQKKRAVGSKLQQ